MKAGFVCITLEQGITLYKCWANPYVDFESVLHFLNCGDV